MAYRGTAGVGRPPGRPRWGAPTSRLVALSAILFVTTGCMRGCTSPRAPIHPNPNMDRQPKYMAQAASPFFYNGATMRPPVEGTVARGELLEDTAFHTGRDDAGEYVVDIPLAVDEAALARGEERYGIYCAPCHSDRGDGRGVLWDRAQIESGDLREERLRIMPAGQIFDTVTNGFGLMSSYRYPIPAEDRWKIIAYLRKLQEEADS